MPSFTEVSLHLMAHSLIPIVEPSILSDGVVTLTLVALTAGVVDSAMPGAAAVDLIPTVLCTVLQLTVSTTLAIT